jgi:hypothetical protein
MAAADGSLPPPPHGATLTTLAAEVGPAAPRAVRAVFRAADESWMLARGQEVASEVILSDGAAFVRSTRAIYAGLTAAQRASLLGYDPSFDGVIVHELLQLRDVNGRYDRLAVVAGLSTGERKQRARVAHSEAVAVRMGTWQTLRDLLGAEHPVMVGLAAAMKPAETTDVAVEGLVTLADTLERLGNDEAVGPEMREDFELMKLDAAHVQTLRDAADKARETARLADAKPQEMAAAQRALDVQDGRVLHAIGIVTRAFRRARRSDSTMLVPELGALARVFGYGARGRDDDEPDAPTPTPPAPTPTPNG